VVIQKNDVINESLRPGKRNSWNWKHFFLGTSPIYRLPARWARSRSRGQHSALTARQVYLDQIYLL